MAAGAVVPSIRVVLDGWAIGPASPLGSGATCSRAEVAGSFEGTLRVRLQVAGWLLAWGAIFVPEFVAALGSGSVGLPSWQVRVVLVGVGAVILVANARPAYWEDGDQRPASGR